MLELPDLVFKKLPLFGPNFVLIDNKDGFTKGSSFMDSFSEFIKLIGDQSRVQDIILIFDVSLNVPDEVVLVEFYLILLFDDICRRFFLLSHLMSISHLLPPMGIPQNSIDSVL